MRPIGSPSMDISRNAFFVGVLSKQPELEMVVLEFSSCFPFPSVFGGFSSACVLARGFKRSRDEVVVKIARSRRENRQWCLRERVDGEVGESEIGVGGVCGGRS